MPVSIVNQFQKFMASKDILHQTLCANAPQQNGVAEHKTGILLKQLEHFFSMTMSLHTILLITDHLMLSSQLVILSIICHQLSSTIKFFILFCFPIPLYILSFLMSLVLPALFIICRLVLTNYQLGQSSVAS